MTLPTYTVECAFPGPLSTTWTNITADVLDLSIRRGRTSTLDKIQAGTCTLTLNDPTKKYAPSNASSPYAPNVVPMRPVRVRATYSGTTYGLFFGFIRRIQSDPAWQNQTATIECEDLLLRLSRVNRVIRGTAPTTTGAAIALILSTCGGTENTGTALATGDTIPNFVTEGGTSALDLIGALLETERGVFYANAAGVGVYEDRGSRYRSPRNAAQATISNVAGIVAPSVDLDAIKNNASVTRSGSSAQTYSDATSIASYGAGDVASITSGYLRTDTQAANLAQWLVLPNKDANPFVQAVDLSTLDSTQIVPMLARDLQDRVTITEATTHTTGDYHIEQIETHVLGVGANSQQTTRWTLAPHGMTVWTLGTSTLDGTHQLLY